MPHLPGQTACELNPILALLGSLRWCHTDLGANALRWPRLVREDRRLSAPAGGSDDMADDHNDGLLAQALLDAGMSRDATAQCPNGLSSSHVDGQLLLRHLLTLYAPFADLLLPGSTLSPCLNKPNQQTGHGQ